MSGYNIFNPLENMIASIRKEVLMFDYNGLSLELYKFANKLIINIGEEADCRYNIMGEEFVEFATYFDTIEELLDIWEKWIKSYKIFAMYKFKGKISDINKPIKIYWRVKPEIKEMDDGKKACYARLLLSNRSFKSEVIATYFNVNNIKED